MLHLRMSTPSDLTAEVMRVLSDDPAVSSLALIPAASVRPAGDIVLADVAREAANDIVDRLRDLGLHREGSIHIEPVRTWISQQGLEAERERPDAARTAWCGRRWPSAPTTTPS